MHANRNKKAVKRVEKGMMKANRIRNLFAVFAIILTTFMITTVFSLGINYGENMKLMQVRTAGTTADVSLAMPTKAQEQQIQDLEYVKTVGTQYMVGSVAEKNDEGRELSIALQYYDKTEWEEHYQEAIKDLEGKYPSEENEITAWYYGTEVKYGSFSVLLRQKRGAGENIHLEWMVSFLHRHRNGICFRGVLQKCRLYNGRGWCPFFIAEENAR